MNMILHDFRRIQRNNGYEALLVLFSMYLERISPWKFPFKIIKLLIQRHYLCDISPYSFTTINAILTCRMPHPFLIIINSATQIGENVTIYHNVTIGNREGRKICTGGGGAKLCDNVFLGCGSVILGDVVVGENSRVGAASIILRDIEENVTITGLYK